MKLLVLPESCVTILRVVSILCFILTSFRITEYSIGFLVLAIVSLYGLKKKKINAIKFTQIDLNKIENPFLKSRKSDQSEIPADILDIFTQTFLTPRALNLSRSLKQKVNAPLQKSVLNSNVWGSPAWNKNLTVKENINLNIYPSFLIFSNLCSSLKLDGFLIELPGDDYGKDLEIFSKAFCDILTCLSELNPTGKNCMNSEIDSSQWVFEFNKLTFFITTFLPIYSETNSRYTFDTNSCFILFQPEISFAFHNLPHDTPNTNWLNPKTIRDKIRIAFKSSGRQYLIRDTVRYPMSHDMIKPLNLNDDIVKWWKYKA